MSERKFKVIKETRIGMMDDSLLAEWTRLCVQKERIEQETQSLEDGFDAFWSTLVYKFGDRVDFHDKEPQLRVTDDGEVFASFCPCPVCQSRLHHLSVTETVEEMYRSDLISSDHIDVFRKKASLLDAENQMSKKLMN